MASIAVERVLQRLDGVKPGAGGWLAKCPAHHDDHQSLKIDERADGSVLLHCHAGCAKADLLAAMELTYADLFAPKPAAGEKQIISTFDYCAITGELLYQCVRFYPKEFSMRRPNGHPGGWTWNMATLKGKHVPYRLPELKGQSHVVVVEGEKDADRLWKLGIPATTNIGGAGKWSLGETKGLIAAGVAHVYIIPDNDGPGQKHATQVATAVKNANIEVSIIALPDLAAHGDVSDWLNNGGSKEALQAYFTTTPVIPSPVIVAPPPLPDALVDPLNYKITATVGIGAAEAFRDRYAARLRYDHRRNKWFIWDQHRWRMDDTEGVMRLALQHSRQWGQEVIGAAVDFAERKKWQDYTLKLERRPDRTTMLLDARALPPFYQTPVWDADPWLLGVPNGVLDLKTGVLRDGQPSDGITLQTGVAYDPDAQCPRWVQFLWEVFDNLAVIEFMQQFCGYCLTGRTSEQIVLFCYGKGRNGKGRLWSALRGVMGEYAAVLPFSSLIASRKGGEASNDLAAIQGKRLVTASEINEGTRLNEARIKALTGEDPITARFLYAEFGTFDPAAKFVLAVNHRPIVKDDSEGFWRRVRLIPFLNKFIGEACDPDLDKKLQVEWPGILAWMVQGCLDWQEKGRLPEPAVMMEATKDYERDSDPLEDFLFSECEDRLTTLDTATETGNAMFSAYLVWCESTRRSKEDRLTSTSFGLALSAKFKKSRDTGRVLYFGVRLKPKPTHLPYEE